MQSSILGTCRTSSWSLTRSRRIIVLCAAPSYVAAHGAINFPLDLLRHECLVFPRAESSGHWAFDGPDGRISVPLPGSLAFDSANGLLAAALAGMGLMLQPLECVQARLVSGHLVTALPKYAPPARPMHILRAPDCRPTAELRSFIDFAVTRFGSWGMAAPVVSAPARPVRPM